MSYDKTHYGEGFHVGSTYFLYLWRWFQKYGALARWLERIRGTKDTITGHSGETWQNRELYVICTPLLTRREETGSGEDVLERWVLYTYVELPLGDRIVYAGDTFEVEVGAEQVNLDESIFYYKHMVLKMTRLEEDES